MSSRTGEGIEKSWEKMLEFKETLEAEGEITRRRSLQRRKWMWNYIQDQLLTVFNSHPSVKAKRGQGEELVSNYSLSPGAAADILIGEFIQHTKNT